MRYLLALPFLASAVFAADPDLPDGTDKAIKQMAAFRLPPGMIVELFAAEPKLASPVAIGIDEKNRVYVAEEFRFNRGTQEDRDNAAVSTYYLLNDDLQSKTVSDRLKIYQKWAHKFPGGMDWFRQHSDQLRLLEDTTGSGRASKSTVLAKFNDPLDGLAAGVLARDGDVYFTCIPNLWVLKKGETKPQVILTGFGVNCAFLGHDLHGLVFGPDGKLYFSVGDRGFHVTSREGKTFSGPRTGAVFRCDRDGSNFEVVHRGLRNPQELAFDEFGNLFADDNNCDKGDHARLVYVVEGGESGWNMAYQSIPAPYMAGPWFAERLWHLQHPGQPAYILPPVGKIGTGPSGFTFTSGTSLPDRYKNAFLMCNYTGNGGIEAFKLKEQGATFEIVDYHDFLKPIRATDCEFGYDGKLYVSDFVDLDWSGKSLGGRIYTVFDPKKINEPVVLETKQLFADGFAKLAPDKLAKLLGHPDQRVRLRAQFALADKGPEALRGFTAVAADRGAGKTIPRLHALWGLGQIAKTQPDGMILVQAMLDDADPEVRAQAAKVLGDAGASAATAALMRSLTDPAPRVQFFAAQSLGKLKHPPAVAPLIALLKSNADKDTYIRHACVMALSRIEDKPAIIAAAKHPSASVRLAVALVYRQWQDPHLVELLDDADPLVASEAARAIHDLPLEELYPALASRLTAYGAKPIPDGDALVRRAIHANFRLGGPTHAAAVLAAAGNANFSTAIRTEALAALADWPTPGPRDRVTGFWRPLAPRDATAVRTIVEAGLADLLAKSTGPLQADALGLILKLGVKADEATFAGWVADKSRDPNARVAALRFLTDRKAKAADAALTAALTDDAVLLRAEARDLIARDTPTRGVPLLESTLADAKSTTLEKQRAILALGFAKGNEAGTLLDAWATKLVKNEVPTELRVDVVEALKSAPTPSRDKLRTAFESAEPRDPVGKHRNSLIGGDAAKGRVIFYNHTGAQCVRCHIVNGAGGTAGPDLSKVAERNPVKTREYLLESLALPAAKIAPGYATISVTTDDGRVIAGTLLTDDATGVTVQTPDGKKVVIPMATIEKKTTPTSAMPAVDKTLTPREMRDLIEFLAGLK